MALVSADQLAAQWRGLNEIGAPRQAALIVGLAAAIALAFGAVLWSRESNYQLLAQGVSDREMAAMTQALSGAGIDYRMDPGGTRLMVPATAVARARMELATADLPAKAPTGYEILDQDTGFGTSRMMEAVRHRRALEGELARSIGSIRGVNTARVHLALPEPSAFLRDRQRASASVVTHLGSAGQLDRSQVNGVVSLVANSVPQLDPARVSVVDQRGQLLSDSGQESVSERAGGYQRLTRQLESEYAARIRDLLSPLVGRSGVRAQVNAAIDYTVTERTREDFAPDEQVVRSERVSEQTGGADGAGGVPGALANQPPAGGEAGAAADQGAGNGAQGDAEAPSGNREVVRNFEIGRTLEYSKPVPGQVQRLSVAVMLDHAPQTNADGELERAALAPEQMERARALVREAVGFDADRGDTLSVTNEAFRRDIEPIPDAPAAPFWDQPRLWEWLRDLLGGLALIAVALFVLRPTLKSLAAGGGAASGALPGGATAGPGLPAGGEGVQAPEQTYEQRLSQARGLAQQDPQGTARIAGEWLDGAKD